MQQAIQAGADDDRRHALTDEDAATGVRTVALSSEPRRAAPTVGWLAARLARHPRVRLVRLPGDNAPRPACSAWQRGIRSCLRQFESLLGKALDRTVAAGEPESAAPAALPVADDCDVLIWCEAGSPPADWLARVRVAYGLDFTLDRDDPRCAAGLADLADGRDTTGFRILRYDADAPGGRVVRTGNVQTQLTWSRTRRMLERLAAVNLVDVALDGGARAAEADEPLAIPTHAAGANLPVLRYVASTARRLVGDSARRLQSGQLVWHLGFQHAHWREVDPTRSQLWRSPPDRLFADPIVVQDEATGRRWCFCEELVDGSGKGVISVLEFDDQGVRHAGIALECDFHLSFPWIFRYEGDWYMCPEAAQSRAVTVYKAHAFPFDWRPVATLMNDVAAADTLLFEHDRRWWMLTNIDRTGTGNHGSELQAFHADSPLSSEWTPHAANPLRIDAAGGRNGGFFVDGGIPYRCGQVQGFNLYGKALVIYRIDQLDAQRYTETAVRTLAPTADGHALGIHTLSQAGGLVLFDVCERRRR